MFHVLSNFDENMRKTESKIKKNVNVFDVGIFLLFNLIGSLNKIREMKYVLMSCRWDQF